MSNKLYVKKLREGAMLPKRETVGSAGYDLCCLTDEPITVLPNERKLIPAGIAIEIPEGTVGLVYSRSGLSLKHGIHMANDVGVIDSDYRGELKVPIHNRSDVPYIINCGDRIAQLVLTPILTPEVEEVNELSETVRGEGGFGSTGKKREG